MPEGTEVRPDAGNSPRQRARAKGSVAEVPGLVVVVLTFTVFSGEQ